MSDELTLADVMARLDEMDKHFNERIDGIDGRLKSMDGRIDSVFRRLTGIENRLTSMEQTTIKLVAASSVPV